MKKLIISLSIIAMIAAVFYSCTKEDEMTKENLKTTADSPQMSTEDLRVMNLIVDFQKKVDFYRANPNVKSGESKSVDSTVWYLEAAANYTYADPRYEGKEYVIDSAFVEISVNNGDVTISDIQLAYTEIENQINSQYTAISGNSKQLIIADISVKEISNNQLTLKIRTGMGKGNYSSPLYENWYWGMELGKCDGTQSGMDATDVLTERVNYYLNHNHPTIGYFTDISDEPVEVYPFAHPTSNNPFGFVADKLFVHTSNTNYICLEWDASNTQHAMKYYYDYILEILVDGSVQPSGKEAAQIVCDWSVLTQGPPSTYGHFLLIDYGIWHTGNPNNGN